MAGHNKRSKVKYIEARVDAEMGKLFGHVRSEVFVATRYRSEERDINHRVRVSVGGATTPLTGSKNRLTLVTPLQIS